MTFVRGPDSLNIELKLLPNGRQSVVIEQTSTFPGYHLELSAMQSHQACSRSVTIMSHILIVSISCHAANNTFPLMQPSGVQAPSGGGHTQQKDSRRILISKPLKMEIIAIEQLLNNAMKCVPESGREPSTAK